MVRLSEINEWRQKLHHLGLIGICDGIGFGNISIRERSNNFIISGSGTGGLDQLNENHYCLVEDYDFAKNSLTCRGPIKASSESLSHAIIYEGAPETNAVIHIHNLKLWEKLMDQVPTTDKNAEFGTLKMVDEIKKILERLNAGDNKILVMGGHEGGIVSWGKTLDEAGDILLNIFKQI